MHATDDPRILRFRDGIWFSRAILQRERADLEALRLKLARDSLPDVLQALALVWQIVDAVRRVRELAENLPGLSKGEAFVRRFLATTETAETFRNYVQHLRTELAKKDVDPFSVWGSLMWVDPADPSTVFATFVGDMHPGSDVRVGVFDAQEKRFVSRVALSVKGIFFNVDPMVDDTTFFCDQILEVIERMQPELPPPDRTSWISARFIVVDGADK